jgi:hypothetical protein
MESQAGNNKGENNESGFKSFAAKRIIVAAVLIIAVVWALGQGLNIFERSPRPSAKSRLLPTPTAQQTATHEGLQSTASPSGEHPSEAEHETPGHSHEAAVASQPEHVITATEPTFENESHPATHGDASGDTSHAAPPESEALETKQAPSHDQAAETQTHPEESGHEVPSHDQAAETQTHPEESGHEQHAATESHIPEAHSHEAAQARGVAFVEAVIKPLDYELNKRFWGWRPNDIINFTDNTNNFQLGVLEVTRRSTVMLTDRISRTGSTDRLNPHLEDASNWLMVTATRYWFPSPESKYKECIKELKDFKEELIDGSATVYIRADNLIPLLASYEDLLGSCDENLVKQKNANGSSISFFKADDYFFYAKGVASAMATILEALHHDFLPTLENRHGTELLHHALISCRQAAALSPLIITDANLDGILANHRANMAAPISHARYYITQLIKTLST